ncbi:tape measure protein [Luteimonas notoginsengisoli]|uniref:Tape measure protein n=1 Tax=Luteimonas notoginsengisoli TaxID=1578200 RepID=A0ABV7UQY3_9GAMM
MAGARTILEEKIRLYVESAGDEELKGLVAQLGDLGDVADFQSNIARKAMERFGQAIEDVARVEAFEKLKRDLQTTEANLESARAGAEALFREFRQGDTSNSGITRAQKTASKTVNELSEAAQRQRLQLQQLRGELSRSGIDTRKLGTAQGELKARLADARGTLAQSVKSVQQFRAENARAAREVPAGNARIADSYKGVGGALTRLRSLAAPVLAFLTFRTAASGARALGEVAQQAEDARRALTELYGSQAAGNRAYGELEVLSKRNGLAFIDVVNQAKRLMSFGLDPLNGSMQALVDQNAAVGGSMEDLDGKILALGQAWAKQKLQGEEILQLVERGVPVWDLLQKATGKNVQELQKLSSAGKLGRDTMSSLIAEIGRANSGAATRSLGSLSGLVARSAARWLEFKQKIVDAGLGDYMKQQLRELLDSTGGMDALAKRVSEAIIGIVNGLKNLGQQILPIAKAVGDATIFVSKHADAVIFLAKAYLALQLARIANGFTLLAGGARAATAATTTLATATTVAGGALGRLSGIIAGIPRFIRISLVVAGAEAALYFWTKAGEEIQKVKDAQLALERVQVSARDLERERIAIGQQLTSVYRQYADVQIKAAGQISSLTQQQAQDYDFALGQARKYWEGQVRMARAAGDAQKEAAATEHWKALQDAITAVQARLKALDDAATAAQGIRKFVDSAVAKFDELANKGKSAKDAIKGAFDGLDLASTKGLQQAADILDQVSIRGTAAGRAVQAELRTALAAVADEDLPKLQAAAAQAFDSGSAAAKVFGRAIDAINLTRLGVDVDAISTGFSKAGRAAVDQFRAAIGEVDRLGFTAAQRADAIAQAFDNAFKKASTKQEIEAMRQALREALSEGSIGFDEFTKRVAMADDALAALSGTAPKLADGVKQGVAEANSALGSLGSNSTTVAQSVEKVGTETQKAGEKAAKSGKQIQQASFAMSAFGDEINEGLKNLGRWVGHPLWDEMQNFLVAKWRAQREEFRAFNKELDEQLAKLNPVNHELEELRKRYSYLSEAELEAGAAKLKQINDRVREQQEQALREQQAAESAAAAARERSRKEGSDAALAKPVEDRLVIDWRAPTKSVANTASAAELEQAERIAGLVAPMVLQRIERSRSISIRRNRR